MIWAGRIKDIAASLDLSDEEIKPALTLKHHEIAKLNSNATAAELAAVVRTLPTAEQQMVDALVDRMLKERGL